MSALDRYRDQIDDQERIYGRHRGRLAVALDLLTEALVVAGAHAVYCRKTRRPEEPSADLQQITEHLEHAKELVQAVSKELEHKT